MIDLSEKGRGIGDLNFAGMLAQAPTPIAVLESRELRFVFVNEAFSAIFNQRTLLGLPIRQALPELEGQSFYEIFENVFDTGIPYSANEVPAKINTKNDGVLETRYYNISYNPYKNDLGQIAGVIAFSDDVTNVVRAKQKQDEAERRFRNIVEQSWDPILILKGEELILDVANEALLKLWNIDKESIGKSFLQILPEMKEQGFHELLLDVYHNNRTHSGFETPVLFNRPGEEEKILYFNFTYQPYYEQNGQITGVLVMAQEVSQQVRAKQSLMHSEHNFRNMVLQAPVAMCILKGPEYILEIANEHIYKMWGKPKEDILGFPVFHGLPEARNQGLKELLDQVYQTGKPFIANERPVKLIRDGKEETAYINFVYEPFREGDGSISGIIFVAIEVTEQVTARHQIEYAEENARLAIESAQLGHYEVNLLTNEMVTSPRFNSIWGFDENTNDREQFAAAIHPDDHAIRQQAHKESLKTGSLEYEARINWKNRSIRWVRIKGKLLYDGEGKPVRLLGVIQDITEQRQFAEELSAQIEERTKALKDANKRLELSNQELEQFAYVASHDLQEPLRKIQFYTNFVLEKSLLDDHAKNYIEKANTAAHRMTGLIRDLLEYSKLSQDNQQFETTDLNLVLKSVLTDFELMISQKHARINYNTLPVLQAIPLQMNQLFYNLIGNALKFSTRDRKPIITISARMLPEEDQKEFVQLIPGKEYYEIIIHDNGIGFNQQYADKIFTIFQRLNEKTMYGGYGIGLAVCRKIIDNHFGIIYAMGQPQQSATFTMILPAQQQ